jgi:hypothetical protein
MVPRRNALRNCKRAVDDVGARQYKPPTLTAGGRPFRTQEARLRIYGEPRNVGLNDVVVKQSTSLDYDPSGASLIGPLVTRVG